MTDKKTGVDTPKAKETPTETKNQKFIRIANTRGKQVIQGLLRIENLAKSSAYDFTAEDTEKLFSAIDKQLETTKQIFVSRLEGKKSNDLEDIF